MDSYQGSTPLNFIPFRLENPPKENAPVPTPYQVSNPAVVENLATTLEGPPQDGISIQVPQPEAKRGSPALSQDSDADVTAYAESVVQRMQQAQSHTVQDSSLSESVLPKGQESANVPPELITTTLENRRSSTTIQSDEEERQEADLSALESALKVIMTSESQLPELRDRDNSGQVDISGAQSRTDEATPRQSVMCQHCQEVTPRYSSQWVRMRGKNPLKNQADLSRWNCTGIPLLPLSLELNVKKIPAPRCSP